MLLRACSAWYCRNVQGWYTHAITNTRGITGSHQASHSCHHQHQRLQHFLWQEYGKFIRSTHNFCPPLYTTGHLLSSSHWDTFFCEQFSLQLVFFRQHSPGCACPSERLAYTPFVSAAARVTLLCRGCQAESTALSERSKGCACFD